jgi:RNA recognition motif-containing protein
MKILIRNLPRTFSESSLNELFDAHGEVQSCNLILDQKTGESKGFGFVEIAKVGDAKAAIQALNGKPISGNKIRVKKAEPTK